MGFFGLLAQSVALVDDVNHLFGGQLAPGKRWAKTVTKSLIDSIGHWFRLSIFGSVAIERTDDGGQRRVYPLMNSTSP